MKKEKEENTSMHESLSLGISLSLPFHSLSLYLSIRNNNSFPDLSEVGDFGSP